MAAVFRRNDFKRNRGSTATVLHSQRFPDEFGQMVNWTHHTAAGDYTWSVVVLKFHGAQPSLWGNCDCKKGGAAIGDRASMGSGGCRVTRGGHVSGKGYPGGCGDHIGGTLTLLATGHSNCAKAKLLWEQQEQQQTVSRETT